MITGTRTYTIEELWCMRIKESTMYTSISTVWSSLFGCSFWFKVTKVTG